MASDPGDQLKETNRHLREISSKLGTIAKALGALNDNYVAVNRKPNDIVEKAPEVTDGS